MERRAAVLLRPVRRAVEADAESPRPVLVERAVGAEEGRLCADVHVGRPGAGPPGVGGRGAPRHAELERGIPARRPGERAAPRPQVGGEEGLRILALDRLSRLQRDRRVHAGEGRVQLAAVVQERGPETPRGQDRERREAGGRVPPPHGEAPNVARPSVSDWTASAPTVAEGYDPYPYGEFDRTRVAAETGSSPSGPSSSVIQRFQ